MEEVIKLDLGAGKNKRQDGKWIGVDIMPFEGVDVVMNLAKDTWPWEDNSVDEVYASHFVEHLEADERIHFANELYRVLKTGEYVDGRLVRGFATIITPHWASQRAYGDLTHKWPPVSEFWYLYLDKGWRAVNAPHNDKYTCDFSFQTGHGMNQELMTRNEEWRQFALKWYKEAAADLHGVVIKKP